MMLGTPASLPLILPWVVFTHGQQESAQDSTNLSRNPALLVVRFGLSVCLANLFVRVPFSNVFAEIVYKTRR
jgi:hypothetical protein